MILWKTKINLYRKKNVAATINVIMFSLPIAKLHFFKGYLSSIRVATPHLTGTEVLILHLDFQWLQSMQETKKNVVRVFGRGGC